jgi:nitrite reductase/ring-hydroxylating ferredoxin subunit
MAGGVIPRALCRLEDIPDGQARGFGALFAIRRGREVLVYVNSCPHIGVSLDVIPDRFLNHQRSLIVCALHNAWFRIEDGFCTHGPCIGDSLEAVAAEVDAEGTVWVPEDAGW